MRAIEDGGELDVLDRFLVEDSSAEISEQQHRTMRFPGYMAREIVGHGR